MATRSYAAASLRSETASLISSNYAKETILRYSDTSEVVLSPDGDTWSGTLVVENPTSRYALFKMKVSKATMFVVRPRVCIVLPHSSVNISITAHDAAGFRAGFRAGSQSNASTQSLKIVRSSFKFLCEEFVYHPAIIPNVKDIHNTDSSEVAKLCKDLESDETRRSQVDIAKLLLHVSVEERDIYLEDQRSEISGKSKQKGIGLQVTKGNARLEERTEVVQSKRISQPPTSPASITSPQEPMNNLMEVTQLRARVDNLVAEVLRISADRDKLSASLASRSADYERLYKEKEELKSLGLRKRSESASIAGSNNVSAKSDEKHSPRKFHLWVLILFGLLAFLIGRLST